MRSLRVSRSRGLTFIEVLVALAVVVVLLVFLVQPSMPRPSRNSRFGFQCMANTKQLTLGWLLYQQDYPDALMENVSYAGTPGTPADNWVQGIMDWSASPQNTDVNLLLAGRLGDYVKTPAAYHCPLDESKSAAGAHVRSYSMNAFLNGNPNAPAIPGWKQSRKLSGVAAPANTFVIVEEHPNSLDDGCFFNDPNQTNSWHDLSASDHNGAGSFSFADGHCEIHKWLDATTLNQPTVPNGPKPSVTVPSGKIAHDLTWILEHTTSRDTNSVAGN